MKEARPPRRHPPDPQNAWWRTVLEAIQSNARTVRLISIILVAAKAVEMTHALR